MCVYACICRCVHLSGSAGAGGAREVGSVGVGMGMVNEVNKKWEMEI